MLKIGHDICGMCAPLALSGALKPALGMYNVYVECDKD